MKKVSPVALLPLVLFLVLFIGSGLYYQYAGQEMPFYQISPTVVILLPILLALGLDSGSLNERVERLIKGLADNTLLMMVLIFLLAGAFGQVANAVGGVSSTVNLGIDLIPSSLILPALFIIAAFVSTAMGTSMGTIGAIAPIAIGVAQATDLSLVLTTGTVVGGAMFGDNLSFISDTTIAATRSQNCAMKDKFRFNFKIALPAALITVVVLYFAGQGAQITGEKEYELIKVLPYLAVLVLAILGLNVLFVLFAGIILAAAVGFYSVDGYSLNMLSEEIHTGYTGMMDTMILALFIGGLGALMKHQGGINWLISVIERLGHTSNPTKQKRRGEISISLSVALTNLCTANNTIAILITGGLAREMADRFEVDRRRSASLLDIFSCVIQGLIPHGAQLLQAAALAGLSPIVLIGSNFYCWLLALAAIVSIILGLPRGNSQYTPDAQSEEETLA